MAHEELKKQYEEDREIYERPWELWSCKSSGFEWVRMKEEPVWHPGVKYRRNESVFQPECFSGLNREGARDLVGKNIEHSPHGKVWSKGKLNAVDLDGTPFSVSDQDSRQFWINYVRTCPETFQHPTITIGEVKLPMPETVSPRIGSTVWILTSFRPDGYVETVWQGYGIDQVAFKKGFVHLTESRAQAWADWWDETVAKVVKK